ncbi:MAG TPA: glycosyltransferase [Steroidobacteraceae bacterium]|nr:glycosyltransferase [Steroidobacteraceae bacterium]
MMLAAVAQSIPLAHSGAPARRLRILHVVPTYYPAVRYGGPIRTVHGLATSQARQGHDVHVYTTTVDGPDDLKVPTDRPVALDEVAVHYFPVPALRRLYWAPALARRLRSQIRDFDVVHLHSVFLWPIWVAARTAERAGVPYIMAPHGMLGREVIRRKSRWLKRAWIRTIERRSLARAAAIHVTARVEAEELRALGLDFRKLGLIPCGVDWPVSHAPLTDGPFASLPARYALFLSRVNWKKGLDRLLQAWVHVHDVPLVIAGNDEEGYQPQLEALARKLGIAHRVLFVGPVRNEHKWALFEHAELFLLPSYSENFGIVVAEAMAMGCPVVVTPEVGAGELVARADAGVISSNEPAHLARVVRDLLADRATRHRLGENGRVFAREQLSWDSVATRIQRLYFGVIRS